MTDTHGAMRRAGPLDNMMIGRFLHIRQLDGLRAIAIGLVFLGHTTMGKFAPGGFGVTLFFFLSGYLITSLLRVEWAQTGRIDFRGFYLRRFLRIQPPLWISMASIALMLAFGALNAAPDPWAVLAQAALAINYAHLWGHDNGLPGMPLWSLAVEEHFYLVFPLLFTILRRRAGAARIAFWCAVMCAGVLGVRAIHAIGYNEIYHTYYWTHTRIDSILFGCILAMWNNPMLDARSWRPNSIHLGLSLCIIGACFVIRDTVFRETLRYTLQGIALFVLFSWCLHNSGRTRRLLETAPMQLVGRYSYTIYLVHYFVIYAVREHFEWSGMIGVGLISAALTIGYAMLMYHLVERPLSILRRRLNKQETPIFVTA